MSHTSHHIRAVVILLAGSLACPAQQGNYSDASIEKLNLQFRALYASAREERLADVRPVVIAGGDNLVLWHGTLRTEGQTVDANYHDLKTIAHVPLALYCVLGSHCDTKLAETQLSQLQGFRELMDQVTTGLPESFESQAIRQRQTSLLRRCTAFADTVLESQTCATQDLDRLIDDVRPALLKNIEDATRLRIDNYHRQMKAWRADMSDEEWSHLHVVIPGASMPRKNSTAVQYFSKLLRERGEGKRIIYAESQFDEPAALRLLGTHILDSQVGVAFFGDPWRMQRDLLGSAADSYLDSLDFDEVTRPRDKPE